MKKTFRIITAIALAAMIVVLTMSTAFAFTSCTKCGRIFENEADFSTHTKICGVGRNNDPITYYCGYCEAVFQTKELLSAHIDGCKLKPVIPQKGNNNTCPDCLESFDVEAEYNNHIQLCKKVYPCSKCGKEFKSQSAVGLHKIACTFVPSEVRIEISIKNYTESAEIKYGDILVLTAETKNLPSGAYVEWKADGDAVKLEPSADGKTCKVEAVGDGTVKVMARVVDANGNAIKSLTGEEIYAMQTIKVNGNFFQKIISFFKNLFKIDRITVQNLF
ncbi:MAG: hypothetical protein IKW12_04270 [Clostridia bacterium]|nr:hypothetical protein [Clostridia bacterium]